MYRETSVPETMFEKIPIDVKIFQWFKIFFLLFEPFKNKQEMYTLNLGSVTGQTKKKRTFFYPVNFVGIMDMLTFCLFEHLGINIKRSIFNPVIINSQMNSVSNIGCIAQCPHHQGVQHSHKA